MATRLELQAALKELTPNVYFQPPESTKMQYPCIVYEWSRVLADFSNNEHYKKVRGYSLTVIDYDADSTLSDSVAGLEYSRFDRTFTTDQLNHFVYTLFF